MEKEIQVFSPSMMDRIINLVRNFEGVDIQALLAMVGKEDQSNRIQIMVTGALSGGYYPGVVVIKPSPVDDYQKIGDDNTVRVKSNGGALEEDEVYDCHFIGTTDDYYMLYETLRSSGDIRLEEAEVITLDYIAKACVTRTSGGAFQDVTFEHRKVVVLGKVLSDETYCTTGDEDCCPTVSVDCCEEALPRCWKITFDNGTGFWACMDGSSVYLTFEPVTETWLCPSATITACSVGADIRIYVAARLRCVGTNALELRVFVNYDDNASAAPDGTHQCYASPATSEFVFTCDTTSKTWTGQAVTCSPEPGSNTIDFTLEHSDCDEVPGDGGGGGGGPGTGTCCTETGDLLLSINCTDDFTSYDNFVALTYDPTSITTWLAGSTPAYDGRFQYYALIDGTVRFYFGCKDGVYHIGFQSGIDGAAFPEADCFTWDVEADNWVSKTVTANACAEAIVATVTLTGDGTSGCSGTMELLITR